MKLFYHIDASTVSLQELKEDLQKRDLIPSRKPLKVNLEKNFLLLERQGIATLEGLISVLKNEYKIPEVSRDTGIGEDYLVLLRREANSYFPTPVPLGKFSGIFAEDAEQLSTHGLNNSKQLFEYGSSGESLKGLSSATGIVVDKLRRLMGMADLVRFYGVGPVFSGMLYDSGIHSLDDFLDNTPEEIIDLYQVSTGKNADFSVSDLIFSQRMAEYLKVGR